MKKHSGFTLIELMVVMAIIAILATAGLTAYSNYLKKARDSARVQTARQIMTKVEELANGGPTPTPAQLVAFLIAENFASADGNGRLKIDPLDGGTSCAYANSSGTVYNLECVFTYGAISDGTYFISYPVEHSDNIGNFWITPAATTLGVGYPSGNILGTNPYLNATNSQQYFLLNNNAYAGDILNDTNYYSTPPAFDEAIISSY